MPLVARAFLVFLAGFLILMTNHPTSAQERARTILVLDASGSMWGQIEGRTKIEIAQDVVSSLLKEIPEDVELGLTVYGHRRKGDCKDIETVVPPGIGTREAIAKAVLAIRPKGKTPLSEAVIRAAQALRYTEEPATVILVSDGRETCSFDPCEVGRKLEEAGIGFTAHVVGFDVADPADRAQLQCLAENTGGRFLVASNASELAQALAEVAAPPAPIEREITLAAVTAGTTERVTDGLVWSLFTEDGRPLADAVPGAVLAKVLPQGRYRAEVLRTSDEASAELAFLLDAQTPGTLYLELPPYVPRATLEAPETARVGAVIDVAWTGPGGEGDVIVVTQPGSPDWNRISQERLVDGSPARVRMPAEPGVYELRYLWNGKVLATRPVQVEDVPARIKAPERGVAGSLVSVEWEGPAGQGDFISVARPGEQPLLSVTGAYADKGSPVRLELPAEPGRYEVRYVMRFGPRILARQEIEVVPVSATVKGPGEALAGQFVQVEWQGPGYEGDFLEVAEPGAPAGRTGNYAYAREGSPLRLRVPPEPGAYEIRYVVRQGRTILARAPLEILPVTARLEAQEAAAAGESIMVTWEGPGHEGDYIEVGEVGARPGTSGLYTYTREGSPLRLRMPAEPGDYEIRYVHPQGPTVFARRPVRVEAVQASVSAPQTATAGADVLVEWSGPAYANDYISVARPGSAGGKQLTYTYTREGSPLRLTMPLEAGSFEIRYVQNQGKKVLARQAIDLEMPQAALSAPERARAGERVLVSWEGPDFRNDFIAVAEPGARPGATVTYTYTRTGSPLRVAMPARPGTYEIRYVANGTPKVVLARRMVEVEPVTARVALAGEARAGAQALVEWQGPGYEGDFIAVGRPGEKRYQAYSLVRDGSPLRVKMPEEPGAYELRYVMKQGQTVLATVPLEVRAP